MPAFRSRHLANLLLLAGGLVCITASPARAQSDAPSRPASLGVQANIVWLYYRDVPAAQRFYGGVLGLPLVVDQGFAKVYQVSPTSFVGLVDEAQGLHRASETKAVTVSFVTEQIDEWYSYLRAKGVTIRNPLGDATRHPTRGFVALDPEGYFLEFERFLDHEQNAQLLAILARQTR
jgi:catechol 2,3-dioxygenase-like lactoylglutathione lyase family enzyme